MKEAVPSLAPVVSPDIPENYLAIPSDLYDIPAGEARSPYQIFIDQVADVREHGDALDAIPLFGQKYQVGLKTLAAPVGVATLAAQTTLLSASEGLNAGGFFGPVLTGAPLLVGIALGARTRYRNRDIPLAEKRMAVDVQHQVDERYDLFRAEVGRDPLTGEPRHEVHMRYYGPRGSWRELPDGTPYGTVDYIKDMAALAEKAGVEKMMVAWRMAERVSTEAERVPMKKILEETKPLTFISTEMNDEVVVRTPQEWQTIGQKPVERRNEDEIAGLIDSLKKVSPQHPIVRAYEEHQHKPAQLKAMHRAIDGAFDRQFSETRKTSRKEQIAGGDNTPYAQHLQASLRLSTTASDWSYNQAAQESPHAAASYAVDWSHQGTTVNSRSLDSVLGLQRSMSEATIERGMTHTAAKEALTPKQEVELLLQNPESDPTQATKYITVLLKQRLDDRVSKADLPSVKAVEVEEAPSQFVITDGSETVMRRLLLDATPPNKMKPDLWDTTWKSSSRKVATGAAAIALVGSVVFAGSWAADNAYDAQMEIAKAHVAEQYNIDPSRLNMNDAAVKDTVHKYAEAHTLNYVTKGWERLQAGQMAVNKALDFDFGPDSKPDSSPSAGSGQRNFGIGDVEHTSLPKAEWKLESKDGLSTEGYWTSSTGFVLEVNAGKTGIEWQGTETTSGIAKSASDHTLPLMQVSEKMVGPPIGPTGPSIKVSRTLVAGDVVDMHPEYIKIPVRAGMRVSAANLDGKPLTLHMLPDQTYALQAPQTINGGNLQYWLVEDQGVPQPRATAEPVFDAHGQNFDLTDIRFEWEEVIPGFLNKGPLEQRALMKSYVKENFTYSFTPFKGTKPEISPSEYTKQVLELKRANCNVAATELALGTLHLGWSSDPEDQHAVLNIAVGYNNSNEDGLSALSDYELHMWDVDKSGTIVDATPSRQEIAAAPQDKEPTSALPFTIGGLLMGAAVGLYASRRWIRQSLRSRADQKAVAEKNQADEAHESLVADPERLHRAIRVVDALRYDPSRNIKKALTDRDLFGGKNAEAGVKSLFRIVRDDQAAQHTNAKAAKKTTTAALLQLSRRERKTTDPEIVAALDDVRDVLDKGQRAYKHFADQESATIA